MSEIKEYKQPTNKIEKGLLYLQHYGFKKTVAKTVRKLMKHDQEHYSYRQFLKENPITKEELEKSKEEAEKSNEELKKEKVKADLRIAELERLLSAYQQEH